MLAVSLDGGKASVLTYAKARGGAAVQTGESGPAERSGSQSWSSPAGRVVALVSALPEFGDAVPPEDRRLAERALVVPLLSVRDEDLAPVVAPTSRNAFDFVVIEGVVLKETTFAARSALELLGPGDVLAPPLTGLRQLESRAVSRYIAHGPVTLAALNDRFRHAARRWPGVADVLHDRLGRQTHRARPCIWPCCICRASRSGSSRCSATWPSASGA